MTAQEPKPNRPIRRQIRLDLELYNDEHIFLITIATYERFPWFQRYPKLADRFCEVLQQTARERSADVFAWCVMPDHVHLLVVDVDVVTLVRLLKGRIVPMARQLKPTTRLWQRSFHDHALRKLEKAEHVARYILENPDRAGLVDSGVYPWRGSNVWPDWQEHDWISSGCVTMPLLAELLYSQDTESPDNTPNDIPTER